MSLLRNQKSFIFPAPPPSPIATGRGLRSAAVDDQILSKYLENTLHLPDLNLPQSLSSAAIEHRRRIPIEIDLLLLSSGDDDSIRQVLESAVQFGIFKITGYGISADELRWLMAEAALVFPIPVELKRDDLKRGKFLWFGSGNTELESLRGRIGPERYQSLSRTMENIFGKLEAIADVVGQILSKHEYYMGNEQRRECVQEGRDPILCLHKAVSVNRSYSESNHYALSFFLSCSDHEFLVQSARGPLSFNAMAGSLVVDIRKQLEEWSNGEFKAVSREPNMVLNSDGSSSFLIEFMCTPSTLSYKKPNRGMRKISLLDQILIVLIVCFLYKFFTYISRFRGT